MSATLTGMVSSENLGWSERTMGRLRRRRLDHRLERTWQQGRRERDARLLVSVRSRIGVTVLAATATAAVVGVGAEITFVDGYHLSLGPCHGPAVAAVAGLIAARGPVVLRRAVRHPVFWELDFMSTQHDAAPDQQQRRGLRLALLAGSVAESLGGAAAGRPERRPIGAGAG